MRNFKFGVIIPNYNNSEFLKRCLLSVLKQSYKNFQIIFIDDMSADNSVEIAKKYLKEPHKVIELKQKRYNGGARNEGYLHLDKDVDYIYYIDSDDYLGNIRAFSFINDRLQNEPDVLFISFYSYQNGKLKECFIPKYRDRYDAIKGWSGSSGKVIKKELALRQDCLFKEGTLKEDRNQHRRICIHMNSFDILEIPIYVWNRDNPKSVTHTNSIMWHISTIKHYADTLELYLEEKGKDKEMDIYLKKKVEATKKEIEEGEDRQW